MKSLTILTFLFVFLMGLGATPSLSAPKVFSHECFDDADAELIVFEKVKVIHPLGNQVCGEDMVTINLGLNSAKEDKVTDLIDNLAE